MVVLLLCFGIGARADNVLTITGSSGAPGEEVTVTVSMTNTDAVMALQLSIPLDENLSLVAGSAAAAERVPDTHAVSAGVKDGLLNVMVYPPLSLSTIAPGEGALLTLRLKVGDTPADIALEPSKLTLTGGDGQPIDGSSEGGTVSIRCAKAQYSTMTIDFGEVPIMSTYHETVTVSNVGNEPLEVTALAFSDPVVFTSATTLPFTVAPGGSQTIDVTYAPTVRGSITKTMTVVCNSVSKLNTIKLTAQPFAVNELHVGNASGISDTEVEVALTMNSMDPIVGFQVEFTLPDALEYVAGSFMLNASRRQDHVATVATNDKLVRILCYSPSGKALNGDDGVIGTFRVKLVGRYGVTLEPSKAILSAVIGGQTINVLSAQYGGNIDIQSPQISASTSLPFGKMPVTEEVTKAYIVSNHGSAPLTISRVVFLDEDYEITPDPDDEAVTISPGQSRTLTVRRTDMTEGDFATTMQVYCNDPGQRMLSVSITGNIFAPNYLTVTADDALKGGDVVLHVATDNYDPIEGIQFEIAMNGQEAFTVKTDAVKAAARAEGLVVTTNWVNSETLRVVAYLMGGSIAPGSGEVFTLRLTPANPLDYGQHGMTIQNILLGTGGMQNKYAGPATMYVFYDALNLQLGDVNGDGDVDLADAVIVINHYVGKPVTTFIAEAADVDGDGIVDLADAVKIINYYVGKIPSLSRKYIADELDPQ